MITTFVRELKPVKLRKGVLVQGLPGLGFAGKIAVDYIIAELRLEKVAEVYSPHFLLPHGNAGAFITMDALLRLPHYEFYYYRGDDRDLLFLAGDIQPVSWGQYEVADKVLDYFVRIGGQEVVVVCGTTAGEEEREKEGIPPVYYVADTEETKKWLESLGFKPSSGGTITGAAGVLPGLSSLRGLKTYVLMGSTQQTAPDPEAGRELVKALIKIFGLKVSLENLDNIIEELRKREEELKKLSEAAERKEAGPPHYYV